jgi:glycerophosphoryl diester phosphodiesterase
MTDTASGSTGRIFISYRRQDSAYPAGWLYDRLVERFGPDQIFKDIDSIELGDDFVDTITSAVGSCDVVLALIGKKWATIKSGRERRLDDPNDFVRLEIEAALQRNVLLIPILVDGALMPRADDLPPSVAPMVRRQALELSPNRFRSDTDTLLGVLERTLADLQHGDDPVEVASPEELKAEEPPAAPPPTEEVAPEEALVEEAPVEEAPTEEAPVEETATEKTPTGETATEETPAEAAPVVPPRDRGSRRVLWAAGAAAALIAAAVVVVLNLPSGDGDNILEETGVPPTPTTTATEPPKLGGSGAPVVLAHRGGEEEFAWQTIPAFEYAASIGANIETDVRWTKDGVPVLVHDPTTTPGMVCEGGPYNVDKTDWDPVLRDKCRSPAAASKNGKRYGIPTFDQAVSTVAKFPWAEIYAEVKVDQSARQVRQFVTILQNFKMTKRAVVTSAKPEYLAKIRDEAEAQGVEDLRTMLFVSDQDQPAEALADEGYWGVAVKVDVISKDYVKQLNDAGLKVMIWVVHTPEQWQLADDVGADLVLTAKPTAYGKWAEAN